MHHLVCYSYCSDTSIFCIHADKTIIIVIITKLLILLFQINLAMKVGGTKADVVINDNVQTDKIDSALKDIHDNCYKELMNKIRDIALELGVNSSSIMSTEVHLSYEIIIHYSYPEYILIRIASLKHSPRSVPLYNAHF